MRSWGEFNPWNPKSNQFQISLGASPEIQYNITVWRTWLFTAYSDERWLYYTNSHYLIYPFLFRRFENVLFELGSERVKSKRSVSSLNNRQSKCARVRHCLNLGIELICACCPRWRPWPFWAKRGHQKGTPWRNKSKRPRRDWRAERRS